METLFRVSHAAYYSKGVRERRIHRFNSISCSALFILLLLSFSQYAKAQIRLKTSQPVIQEKQTRTITQEFNLGGSDREIVELTISTTGVIEAKAEWSGTAGELALILNGPGRSQYYERRDGKSPLVLRYKVSRNLLSSGKTWKLSVVNFRSGTSAKGKVQINFIETAESEQAEEPLKEEGKRPGIKPVTEAVIKPVTEKRKFIQIKQYEVRESQGYNDQQLEGIKVQLEAQKIERTTVKLENRIKEIGPENPLVQIVVPLLYKSLEEQTEKPLIKNRINTSPHLASLIQSYKELSQSITGEYIHPRYSNLRAGQRIDRLQLGKDILEAIRPAYENEIRQMVRNSISPESLKFQWNTAVVRKSETPVVRPVRLQPDQKSIRELETLTNRLRINPTQDNL